MKHKEGLTNKIESTNEDTQKTATDNQWTSMTNPKVYKQNLDEKTATDNQWVSTNKNM